MTIEAFAKVNFTLEVFAERADGFHALRSLVAPVTFSDTLVVEDSGDGMVTSDAPYADDLCVRAALALRKTAGSAAAGRGARISIEKRIPAGGGLGGGSADAAATLVALNSIWGLGLTPERLAAIGAAAGSDVPALVLSRFCGPVIMEGRGEIVRKAEGGPFPEVELVFANPGVHSSTPEVYAACTPQVADSTQILYNMLSALRSGDADAIADAMQNDLEEAAVGLHPEIGKALEAMLACGVRRAMVDGSGSTVFGPVPNGASGEEIARRLQNRGLAATAAKTRCPVV